MVGTSQHSGSLDETPPRFNGTKRMAFTEPDGGGMVECLQGRVVDVSVEHPSRKSRVGYAKPIWAMILGEVKEQFAHYVSASLMIYFE